MNQLAKDLHNYDLEERTLEFARQVRAFVNRLPASIANQEDGRQLLRTSGSTGANYIEANNALGKKDFRMRIRICCKETKECGYWLRLIDLGPRTGLRHMRQKLLQESTELMSIFGTILWKTS